MRAEKSDVNVVYDLQISNDRKSSENVALKVSDSKNGYR